MGDAVLFVLIIPLALVTVSGCAAVGLFWLMDKLSDVFPDPI